MVLCHLSHGTLSVISYFILRLFICHLSLVTWYYICRMTIYLSYRTFPYFNLAVKWYIVGQVALYLSLVTCHLSLVTWYYICRLVLYLSNSTLSVTSLGIISVTFIVCTRYFICHTVICYMVLHLSHGTSSVTWNFI